MHTELRNSEDNIKIKLKECGDITRTDVLPHNAQDSAEAYLVMLVYLSSWR